MLGRLRGTIIMTSLYHARRLILTWVVVSGVAAYIITIKLSGGHLIDALFESNVWIAALMGLVVGTLACPLFTMRWMQWYWGALIGLPVGLLVVFGFFFVRPHSWQPSRWDAWKSVAMFVDIYPFVIITACLLAGSLGVVLNRENTERPQAEE